MSEGPVQLQFAPFSSALDAGFWPTLSKKKLDEYKLDDQPRELCGYYYNGDPDGVPCRLCVEYNAFEGPGHIPSHLFPTPGTLVNFNTLNAFKDSDKKNVLEKAANQIWEDIKSGKAITEPSLLSRFMLLTFCDLKKYHYHYWFAFPALVSPQPITVHKPAQQLTDVFTTKQVQSLQKEYDSFVKTNPHRGFFLVVKDGDSIKLQSLDKAGNVSKKAKVYYGFCDPCTLKEHPGWPLRNFLALISCKWSTEEPVSIICYRDRRREGQRSCEHSIVIEVNLPSMKDIKECPKCVGWERSQKNKLTPRMVDLSSSMDPHRLAETSVDLNLKLMRWRLIEELNLDKVQQTKCLLLGAGTLGCNVARCLIGWGVRTVTFVDNSTVSYSNPVRQSLFEFEDSQNGGQPKAITAAEKLRKIFPGVTSSGHQFSIPMPGHAVGKSDAAVKQVKEDVGKLEDLVDSHDVVFLLMDTRESRWLPTLIAASKRKQVINAALGFDTFLVLRHGIKSEDSSSAEEPVNLSCIPGDRLGCYFCNDVVAPGNSTRDRTLDQQCTVSRPGLSMVAAALAVELMVSLLQHPNGGNAAADTSSKDDHLNASLISPLGLVPHQIRGFIARFHTILPASLAFNKCTACSESVISGYRKQGFNFLLKAFNQPSFLEDHSGLTSLHQEIDFSEIIAFSDDESVKSTE